MSDALREQMEPWIGQENPPWTARDVVNPAMIRHWCDAVGDGNPVYTDPERAAKSVHGTVVAPPTMLQAWIMPGLAGRPTEPEDAPSPMGAVMRLLDEAGYTSVVATNCRQEYRRYLREGDLLTVTSCVERVSAEKRTALGIGRFVDQLMLYRDGDGEEVARMTFRILKFKPPGAPKAEAKPPGAPARRGRPRPASNQDTAFFWEAVARGELRIQRCTGCGDLRHPPGPMCPGCRSLEWDTLLCGGRGEVFSHVVAHHPPIPPFEYPNLIVLVELEEGVRLVSNLVGVDPADVRIGQAVEVAFTEVEEGLVLPLFRPAANG